MIKTHALFTALLVVALSLFSSSAVYANEGELIGAEQVELEVNVNSASVTELADKLVGVGEAKAQLIIEYREKHGPFTSLDQLLNVKGIGTATLDKNRERIRL
ncbi:ComEA family DNA-binding protein [uncultured Microbulbifer sp.]|uniref:ComEA family DNA-binding protein n=1 Tax=uncultured Microbulbifer sp. TaxID=348147 RepID=UPI002614D300|nr:ComEA family DNA-binding protein [uncultured Microbulbifer sp.]